MILIAHSFFLCRDPKQLERAKPYSPLTSLLAAAILRDVGYPVSLFDATFEDGPASFETALDRTAPAVVLIVEDNFNYLTKMCTETRRSDALEMVRVAQRRGCKVAVNSPDSSDHPLLYLEAGVDAVLAGEGEFGVVDLVAAFAQGAAAVEGTNGLYFLGQDGGLRRSSPRRERPDLDSLPLPAWDLVDVAAYRARWESSHGFMSWNMAASRGCPYRCNWCAKPTFGRRYSQRSPGSVAKEMSRLKAQVGPDHLWFADDIFGMTAGWIEQFSHEVVRRGAVIPFMMQSRVNLIDGRVAAALRSAGAQEVWLGVESGSQRILDAMDKGSRVQSARTATRRLRNQGIRVGWFLQLGYPPEDWGDILLTRDLMRDEAPDEIGVSVSYPLPGTLFHKRVVAELGPRRNWRDTDELAMLFQGTFHTNFYRQVRDALHAEIDQGASDDERWTQLASRSTSHRLRPIPLDMSA